MSQPVVKHTERVVLAVTEVEHEVEVPIHRPPTLGDLRAFVAACDGLPDKAAFNWRSVIPGDKDHRSTWIWRFWVKWEEPA